MSATASIHYLPMGDCELCTLVLRPEPTGKFPTVTLRSPYENDYISLTDEQAMEHLLNTQKLWADRGYVFVFQHCRGTGKSTGDSDAFVYDREEGLALQQWIREQDFYNGEIFLYGGSYCGWTSMSTAPFAPDIKGVVLDCTDGDLYNFMFLNGFYRTRLHGGWYVDRYKNKSPLKRNTSTELYLTLPMTEYSTKVFGESSKNLDEYLMHPDKSDEFWNTDMGGVNQRNAVATSRVPMIVTTGFFDIFNDGSHAMWDKISDDIKDQCAFVIHPYGHSGAHYLEPFEFEGAGMRALMPEFEVDWFDHIRNNTEFTVPLGKVTYYELYGGKWCSEDYDTVNSKMTFTLGDSQVSYDYDPKNPAPFIGGLSNNFESTAYMAQPNLRDDVITCYTPEFEQDVHVRGKMSVRLRVKTDREDTAFYVRIGLAKEGGDVALRDSIVKIADFCDDYKPNTYVDVELVLDKGAFMIHKGEKLRIDVTSSAFHFFVPHTNNKGLFTIQTEALVANNTVDLSESTLTIGCM